MRTKDHRGNLVVSLAGLALLVVACSGRSLDRELVVDTSAHDVDGPPAPRPVDAGTARDPAEEDGPDAGSKPHALPEPADCDPDACTLPSGDGFAVALFGDARAECPEGFRTADVVENPTARQGACSCGQCATRVDCTSGTLPSFYDNGDGKCTERGPSLRANGGACDERGGRFGVHASIAPPRAIVGACTAAGVASREAVTTTARRMCTPRRSTCPDRACDAPVGMQACLVQKGDVECPESARGWQKHVVGADFTLACADCGCRVDAACEGTMKLYKRKHCEGTPVETLASGQCTQTDGAEFESSLWVGTVGPARCQKDAPARPVVGLEGTTTVCCPP